MEKLNHGNFEEKKNQTLFKAGASENTSLKQWGGSEFKLQNPSRKPDGAAHICIPSIPTARWDTEAGECQGACWPASLEYVVQKQEASC